MQILSLIFSKMKSRIKMFSRDAIFQFLAYPSSGMNVLKSTGAVVLFKEIIIYVRIVDNWLLIWC